MGLLLKIEVNFMDYIKAFLVGGIICVIGQVLIDKTKLTSARILVLFVVLGCILGGIGIYPKIVDFAGAGATIPLLGFGNNLAKGVINEVNNVGFIGIFSGGIKSAATGVTASIAFAFIMALIFNPKEK
jgi:stage V sporulation protein AE